jgi:large subunit ribosomal protein L5
MNQTYKTTKDKQKDAYIVLKKHGFENVMQAPRIMKVVVSAGTGKYKDDKKKIELISDRLAKITGQKPALRGAKKSIATYKSRVGDPIGYQVTLRGNKMWQFLEKLINIAIPRTKDFRGLSDKSADAMGNYTLGIKEHTIFPEAAEEELKDVFGFAVTIVTNLKDSKHTIEFLKTVGLPIKVGGSKK